MSESVDWGVPNWLRREEYPSPKGPHEMAVWAWEFLRRNPRYRTFWTEKFLAFFDGWVWNCPRGAKELLADFGLIEPCDPRQTNKVAFAATATRYRSAPLSIKAAIISRPAQHTCGLGLRPASIDDWEKIRETHVGQRFDLSDTEMAFVINLDQPLDSQLRSIERIARRDQEKLTKSGFVTVSKTPGSWEVR
jgi:hypothetical protein